MQSEHAHGVAAGTSSSTAKDATLEGLPAARAARDLSKPHDKFPYCSVESLYDRVTSMYLDCWDDAEIAGALSAEFRCDIREEMIGAIRMEAALEAEARRTPEVRRKWIYRYKNLTVNNLVREYMFMEGKTDFLSAKMELADEIDFLVRTTPADRLWIAVNDALGRNNIGEDLIHGIQAYGKAARKVESAVGAYEKSKGIAFRGGVGEVAKMVAALHGRATRQDVHETARFMATLLGRDEKAFDEADVEFCLEYNRHSLTAVAGEAGSLSQIMQGADVAVRAPSLLDQVLGGISRDLSSGEILQLVEQIKKGPLLSRGQGEKIRSYAARHISDDEMRKKLAVSEASSRRRQDEMATIQILVKTVDDHISLTDARTFFTSQEIAHAERRGVMEPHLQSLLSKLNLLRSMDAVVAQIHDKQLHTKFDFPAERYCMRRFGVPGPFGKQR